MNAVSFDQLAARYGRELRLHCYRMTGSLADAEDLAQDALLKAWEARDGFEGRASVRTWLYRIATNTCLHALEKRKVRDLPHARAPAGDPRQPPAPAEDEALFLDPCPDAWWQDAPLAPEARLAARESVALAFLAALQHLPPLQRAVVILREVLGFSAAEAAAALDTTDAAINSALQRARATLEARRDALDSGHVLSPEDETVHALLRRYVAAWEAGDAAQLVALLREDARFTMPPVPTWFSGRDAIIAFLTPLLRTMGPFQLVPCTASGQPALAAYLKAPDGWVAQALHVLAVVPDGGVLAADVFMKPGLFKHFGLPFRR
ncbi:MAG: RNA polymerase subunit sigma-70 [Myxococcota bacterium]